MGSIEEKEAKMVNFLDELERTQKEEELRDRARNNPESKLRKIKNEKEAAKEGCVKKIFEKMYINSLPLDQDYKNSHMSELSSGVYTFIQDRYPKGAAMYLVESSKRGSKPAARILESVEACVNSHFKKFYENLDETDIDDIKMDTDSKEVETNLDQITIDLDLDEISDIIENNVKSTIQHEMQQTKEEDEKLQALKEKLAEDEEIVTEAALDRELERLHMRQKGDYKPSLFEGIMMNKIELIQEATEGEPNPELVQKQAFTESVEEFTKWSMLTVLNMENVTGPNYDRLARAYAQANHFPKRRNPVTTRL